MPFTFSHPAAVLPLLRGLRARPPLVAAGLVAGSMAPDLPFFAASWRPEVYRAGALTHRWWAVPTVDVALAAGLVVGWHVVLRRPLLGLLPERWQTPALAATARRPRRRPGEPDGLSEPGEPGARMGAAAQVGAFALSAALGAAGHVGWDAFTHQGRAGVRLLPVLERRVAGVPLCTVAQYGSSALALAALGRYLARELDAWPRSGPAAAATPGPGPGLGQGARRALVGLAAALGAGHRVARAARVRGPGGHPSLIADLCFGAGAGAATGAAALALLAARPRPA